MELLLFICAAFLIIIFLFYALDYFYCMRAGKILLREWAVDNRYELLSVKYGLIRLNPFFMDFIWKKRLFRVLVKTQDNKEKTAWILVGDVLSGLRVKEFEVKWIN